MLFLRFYVIVSTKNPPLLYYVIFREQLKYERDKNRDLKKSLEAKSMQVKFIVDSRYLASAMFMIPLILN